MMDNTTRMKSEFSIGSVYQFIGSQN